MKNIRSTFLVELIKKPTGGFLGFWVRVLLVSLFWPNLGLASPCGGPLSGTSSPYPDRWEVTYKVLDEEPSVVFFSPPRRSDPKIQLSRFLGQIRITDTQNPSESVVLWIGPLPKDLSFAPESIGSVHNYNMIQATAEFPLSDAGRQIFIFHDSAERYSQFLGPINIREIRVEKIAGKPVLLLGWSVLSFYGRDSETRYFYYDWMSKEFGVHYEKVPLLTHSAAE